MNIYIVADIEGVAGVVFYEHLHANMSMLNYELIHRNRVLLTEEVNAAGRGAFDAGAGLVVVHDHHGEGYTIIPELLDERVELIHGRSGFTLNLPTRHPDLDKSFQALVLVGMHARAGTPDGGTPHSLICVSTTAGKTYELSEATMSMAIAGDVGVPCAFVSGDQALVQEARQYNPDMESVVTKKHYASQLARTKSPLLARKLIGAAVQKGLANLSKMSPFKIQGPCSVRVADRNPAARWPEKPNVKPTFTEALQDTLRNVPWYKPVEMIDDGWRWPDRTQPTATPGDKWNLWKLVPQPSETTKKNKNLTTDGTDITDI